MFKLNKYYCYDAAAANVVCCNLESYTRIIFHPLELQYFHKKNTFLCHLEWILFKSSIQNAFIIFSILYNLESFFIFYRFLLYPRAFCPKPFVLLLLSKAESSYHREMAYYCASKLNPFFPWYHVFISLTSSYYNTSSINFLRSQNNRGEGTEQEAGRRLMVWMNYTPLS